MVHVYRYLSALGVLVAMFCAYALLVAPWVSPPRVKRREQSAAPAPPPGIGLPPQLVALFPPDAWERKNPKIVETEQCTLLVQDYVAADGRLELKPCTLVFQSRSGPGEERGRPVVLQAPKAELVFDKPLDLARGELGRVEKGTLAGEIRIFSPPTQPDGSDAFYLETRAVWLDRESIRTANDVEFRYGNTRGRGRDLEITLVQSTGQEPRSKAKFRGVQAVTLKRLEYLQMAMPASMTPASGLAPTGTLTAPPPLEIGCRGYFTFDVVQQRARFLEGVIVRQALPDKLPDALHCEELLLEFGKAAAEAEPKAPTADAIAGRLRRLVASGKPATLESPSRGIKAEAASMEYVLAERSFHLQASSELPWVKLWQGEQHFVAPEVHYQMPEQGRLGRLLASGPGELRMEDRRNEAKAPLTARWKKSLEVQPQDNGHVISLSEQASVEMTPMGKFEANELHFWVREIAAPAASTVGSSALPGQQPLNNSAAGGLVPDRLLAMGNVRMVSPGLDMDTARLEAWFLHLPAEKPVQQPPRGIDHPIREPVAPVAYSEEATPEATIRGARPARLPPPPKEQKFHVSGDVVRTQLILRGGKLNIEDLSIRGHAQIDEVLVPEPNLEPLRVRSDFLELRAGTQPHATAEMSGFPAEIAGRGMALAGNKIELVRLRNEVAVNGAGEAKLPMGTGGGTSGGLLPLPGAGAQPATAAVPPRTSEPIHIIWQRSMIFDGLNARFHGDIEVRTALQTARMPALEATLNRRIDFGMPVAEPAAILNAEPLGLARVVLDGGDQGVHLDSRGYDELGNLASRDQMHVKGAVIDQQSGGLHAQGPGWLSTVRRGNGTAIPGGAVPAAVGVGVGAPGAALPVAAPAAATGLSSVHVSFEREMVGDLNQRWVEFRQEVRTTHSPAIDFGQVIAADPLAPLSEQMVLMRSQTLRLTDNSAIQPRSFELLAAGGTKVEGRGVFVDAPRVGYVSDKEMLTIQGEGRVLAKVFSQRPEQPGNMEGQSFRYNLRTGELILESVNIQFGLGPAGLKLPVPGSR